MPTLIDSITGELATCREWAWRLQTHRSYVEEGPVLERFLADGEVRLADWPWWKAWLDLVRSLDGKVWRTVVYDEPETDWQRLQQSTRQWHTDAGEHWGAMTRGIAQAAKVPLYDFWLIDGERLILMLYDQAGALTGMVLITSDEAPEIVAQHVAWRDLALHFATTAAVAA